MPRELSSANVEGFSSSKRERLGNFLITITIGKHRKVDFQLMGEKQLEIAMGNRSAVQEKLLLSSTQRS